MMVEIMRPENTVFNYIFEQWTRKSIFYGCVFLYKVTVYSARHHTKDFVCSGFGKTVVAEL